MIKTLRITSIVAAILAGIFFVFPVVFGVRNNEQIEKFLSSPGVIEQFKQTRGDQAKRDDSRVSPLVQQAEAFALYLNPPPKPTIPQTLAKDKTTSIIREMPVTPKFKVLGTSVFNGNPEMSLALIDEPGKGRHWVRQSSTVGHLLIEQIKEGLVVVKGGEGTFELALEKKQEKSPLEGPSPVSAGTSFQSRVKSALPATGRTAGGVKETISKPPQPDRTPEQNAKMEELVDRLKELQRISKSDKTTSGPSDEERNAQIEELISKFRAERVSTEEAKKLGSLGEKLKGIQEDPNQSPPAADKGTVEADQSKSNNSAAK